MATAGHLHVQDRAAWLLWVFVHVHCLVDFRNRTIVMMRWAWTYLTNRHGARLIMDNL